MIKHYVLEIVFQVYKFLFGMIKDGINGWILVKEEDDRLGNTKLYFKQKSEIRFVK